MTITNRTFAFCPTCRSRVMTVSKNNLQEYGFLVLSIQ